LRDGPAFGEPSREAAAEDLGWIETMVHPGLSYLETGQPMPQNLASLKRWNRYAAANGATLEQELMPISIVITGNVAVVSYYYKVARGNDDTLTTTTHHHR
jgi:hypothetical protein